MKRTNNALDQARNAARHKYAWPGGYPLAVVMADGECICPDCAKKEWRQIVSSTLSNSRDGWKVEGADVNWEDDSLYCAHCNERIESAYGED